MTPLRLDDQNGTTVVLARVARRRVRLATIPAGPGALFAYLTPVMATAVRDWLTAWLAEQPPIEARDWSEMPD